MEELSVNPDNSHDPISIGKASESGDSSCVDPLERALLRVSRTRDFPTISKYVIEINQKLSESCNQSSASELANIILKDYALTNKLLKLVNSAFYGFVAGKVTTITRAVVLLGYDNVRLAAISLVLFEHFKGKSSMKDLKEATIGSFWCGLLAKEIAKMQYMIDPEEAFICALLHQLGKLLAIYHMPDEYREIKYRVSQQGESEGKAVKQILGVSYMALGIAVAKQWNFPEGIFKTMASLSIEDLEDKSKRIDPLCALSNFTNALFRIINEVRLDRRDAAMRSLLDRYSAYVTISFKQLIAVMTLCLDYLHTHADALQISLDACDFLLRLAGGTTSASASGTGDIQDHDSSDTRHYSAFHLADHQADGSSAANCQSDDVVGIIMGGIQEIGGVMLGDHDISDVALMSLEIIYRALQCNRTILFINESTKKEMAARYGYGAGIQRIVGKIRFAIDPAGEEDLFLRSMRSGKDLIVNDSHAPELFPLIPEWYRKGIDAQAFVFLPIAYQNICVGAYYADMEEAGPPISALDLKYLSLLRNQLILAIKMGR
jgi:eukaryotic-like serine/threonine-protein kinase